MRASDSTPEDQLTGQAMMNVALAMMREVKEDLLRINEKLDEKFALLAAERREEANQNATERRGEAREHGALEVRMGTLEAAHRRHAALFFTVAAGMILGFLTRWFGLGNR